MTTWANKAITKIQNYLARETDDNLLRESGDILLLEDSSPNWVDKTKNTSTAKYLQKHTIADDLFLTIEDGFSLLLDSTYYLTIETTNYPWSYKTKN